MEKLSMDQSLPYYKPVVEPEAFKDNGKFGDSVELFEEDRDYREALLTLLDSIDPELRKRYGNAEQTRFSIPHGPIIVQLELTADGRLEIVVPFVSLPETGRVPCLRQVAELNFDALGLGYITLQDNKLSFRYDCPMESAHPSKIYWILRKICTTADNYDAKFVFEFGAARICEPQIRPYDESDQVRIYYNLQELCRECLRGVEFFEEHRNFDLCRRLIVTTLFQIVYFACPQGELRKTLDQAIEYSGDIHEEIAHGKEVIEQLQAMTQKQLAQSLYYVETFIFSAKCNTTFKDIQDDLRVIFNRASDYRAAPNDYNDIRCSLLILNHFYFYYYYFYIDEYVNLFVSRALEVASAMGWMRASGIFFNALKNIMENDLDTGNFDNPFANKKTAMKYGQAMRRQQWQFMIMSIEALRGIPGADVDARLKDLHEKIAIAESYYNSDEENN